MTPEDPDVLIVGARCAGCALGILLARSGAKVLLVDRDPRHTDQVLSTHTIHPPGIDILDELGVGEGLRSRTPPTRTVRLAKNNAWVDSEFADGRAGYCPRRLRLDAMLQDAAEDAGARLLDRTRVTEVLFEGGRAVGARVVGGGRTREIRAGLVVGADGRTSTVAREVQAEEYMGYDAPRAMYWGYWEALPEWRSELYPFDMYLGHRGDQFRVIFQTDDDRLLIGSLPPVSEAQDWRMDAPGSLRRNLLEDPFTSGLVRGQRPVEPVRGTIKERYFFRRAAGPGWALVGDAGHHKDFIIGDGITEALIQARNLAAAVLEGGDQALIRWWRARDVRALPGFFWGQDEGFAGPPKLLQSVIMENLASDPETARLMTKLPEHEATPYDVLPPSKVLPWLLAAVLRGRWGVIPEFLAFGRRAREFNRALGERKRFLAEVESPVGA